MASKEVVGTGSYGPSIDWYPDWDSDRGPGCIRTIVEENLASDVADEAWKELVFILQQYAADSAEERAAVSTADLRKWAKDCIVAGNKLIGLLSPKDNAAPIEDEQAVRRASALFDRRVKAGTNTPADLLRLRETVVEAQAIRQANAKEPLETVGRLKLRPYAEQARGFKARYNAIWRDAAVQDLAAELGDDASSTGRAEAIIEGWERKGYLVSPEIDEELEDALYYFTHALDLLGRDYQQGSEAAVKEGRAWNLFARRTWGWAEKNRYNPTVRKDTDSPLTPFQRFVHTLQDQMPQVLRRHTSRDALGAALLKAKPKRLRDRSF